MPLPRPLHTHSGTLDRQRRRFNIRTSKVVGIRKEESDALIRLADAVAGFVRQALMGTDEKMKALFEQAKKQGYLKEV